MKELEQLRAKNIELTAQVERLRAALRGVESIGGPECSICHHDYYHHPWCLEVKAKQALTETPPTGIGADVLALARAAYSVMLANISVGWEHERQEIWAHELRELDKAAQPFLDDPEKRKWLGVE